MMYCCQLCPLIWYTATKSDMTTTPVQDKGQKMYHLGHHVWIKTPHIQYTTQYWIGHVTTMNGSHIFLLMKYHATWKICTPLWVLVSETSSAYSKLDNSSRGDLSEETMIGPLRSTRLKWPTLCCHLPDCEIREECGNKGEKKLSLTLKRIYFLVTIYQKGKRSESRSDRYE